MSDFPTKSSVVARMMQKNQPDPNAAFPAMLHRMLTDIEELSNSDADMAKLKTIVSWKDHGRAFKVHDKKKFISVVMPVFFVRLKYTSFVRQLNTFNFKRVSEGDDKGALFHESFIRGMPELTKNIPKMKKRKSNASLPRTVSLTMEQQPAVAPSSSTSAQNNLMNLPHVKGVHQWTGSPQGISQDSLRSLIRTPGASRLQAPPKPPTQEPLLDLTPITTPLTSQLDAFDSFVGQSDWLQLDKGHHDDEQNHLQHLLNTAAQQYHGPSADDCFDLEPVPISPQLDNQSQSFSAFDTFQSSP